MRKEIEKTLLRLQIEGKEARKKEVRNVIIYLILVGVFFVPLLFDSELIWLAGIGFVVALVGGLYVGIESIPTLYKPHSRQFNAFIKIAQAIQILEKSSEPIAYEEAYRHVKHAHKILKKTELAWLRWYFETNLIFLQFLENLQLIVLPSVSNSDIKIEHLEEIALAIVSGNADRMGTVNKTLVSEPSYKKVEPPPKKLELFRKRFQESLAGKLLMSLALGYGVVLILCTIYVFATQQDFVTFARERPDIVVLGGLIASGITFWRTKPQSQWKSTEMS